MRARWILLIEKFVLRDVFTIIITFNVLFDVYENIYKFKINIVRINDTFSGQNICLYLLQRFIEARKGRNGGPWKIVQKQSSLIILALSMM